MDEPADNESEPTEESGPTEDDSFYALEDDFFHALADRDLKQAAAVLRSMGGLSPRAAENLADLLEGNPKQEKWFQEWFPYCFALRRWRPGKPTNPVKHGLGEAMFRNKIVEKINEKLKTEKKVYLAIAAVANETNLGPSTLWSVWSRYKNQTPPNS